MSEPTIFSMQCYDRKVTVEINHSDISASDAIESFYAVMIGHTWLPETIIKAMKEFIEEHELSDDNLL